MTLTLPTISGPKPAARSARLPATSMQLSPIDLLLEEPNYTDGIDPGRVRLGDRATESEVARTPQPPGLHPRWRTTTHPDDDDDACRHLARRISPLRRLRRNGGAIGRTSVQDHQTKGDQPFQALIAKQIQVQPPSAVPATELSAAARPEGPHLLRLPADGRTAGTEPSDLFDSGRDAAADRGRLREVKALTRLSAHCCHWKTCTSAC